MSRQTQALYVQPNGHTEPFYLDDEPKRQQSDIADELDGPVTAWRLGRHMTAHTSAPGFERTRNEPVRCAWRDLAGADAPDLRGPVIVTGPESRDGLLQPLPPHAAERIYRWARPLRAATIRRRPQMSAAQAVGTRDLQCDTHALHHDRVSGRWAFVVLDGVGDEEDVQEHVRTWAPELARAAARSGEPISAIAHVRAQILTRLGRRWNHMDPGAAAVVAVYHPTNPRLRLAWSGDARAYRLSHIGTLVPLTKDHNFAQELRDAGRQPKEWDHNSLMACLEDGDIGFEEAELDVVAQLVLCSDGVHHPLETYEPGLMEEALLLAPDAKEGAGSLVAEALAQGRTRGASQDNATALVVRFPRPGA